jgi:hypothetical protein
MMFRGAGSIAELEELSGVRLTDLHREHVDQVSDKRAFSPCMVKGIPLLESVNAL